MEESKIKELIQDPKCIFVFDVDGVLAPLELGKYTHYALDDDAWAQYIKTVDPYQKMKPFSSMQSFIKNLDITRVYVVTKVMNDLEKEYKIKFLKTHYHILENHVYHVYDNSSKLTVLQTLKKHYPELEDKYFIMIDDSVDVLNHILTHSSFSTMHISSFLN